MADYAAANGAEARKKLRARAREEYVRSHAPTVFAGLCSDKVEWSSWETQLAKAVELAGLLFDETEPYRG